MTQDHKQAAIIEHNEEGDIQIAFRILQGAIAANNYEKGWRAPGDEPRNMGELIALLHSEVSEAFEAYRNNEPTLWFEHEFSPDTMHGPKVKGSYKNPNDSSEEPSFRGVLGKPQGIASELADVIIRIFDMADENEIALAQAVLAKHAYNQTRPWKHGGKAV